MVMHKIADSHCAAPLSCLRLKQTQIDGTSGADLTFATEFAAIA
jgi:hypothetical protein